MNKQCQCCCSKCKPKSEFDMSKCNCRGCKISKSGMGYQPCSGEHKERPPEITNGPAIKLWPSGEIIPDHVPAPPLLNIGEEQKRKTTFWGKWFR